MATPKKKAPINLPSFKATVDLTSFPALYTIESKDWKNTPLGGDNRYKWPIIWSAGLAAAANSQTVTDYLASTITPGSITLPIVPVPQGGIGAPVTIPKTIIYRARNFTFDEGLQAITAAILSLKTKLKEAQVFAALGPLDRAVPLSGTLSCGFPARSFTETSDTVETVFGPEELFSFFPDFENFWLCGDLMIINMISPFFDFDETGDTPYAVAHFTDGHGDVSIDVLDNAIEADKEAWDTITPFFNKILSYQAWINLPQIDSTYPGFNEASKTALQDACADVADPATVIFEDLGSYSGPDDSPVFPSSAAVSAAIAAQIKTFFGLP